MTVIAGAALAIFVPLATVMTPPLALLIWL
jgi:hypothetical protein